MRHMGKTFEFCHVTLVWIINVNSFKNGIVLDLWDHISYDKAWA